MTENTLDQESIHHRSSARAAVRHFAANRADARRLNSSGPIPASPAYVNGSLAATPIWKQTRYRSPSTEQKPSAGNWTTLQPAAKLSARILSALPKAAEVCRHKIASGLHNDPTAALEARLILRKLMTDIRFVPDADGGLYAEYEIRPGAILLFAPPSRRFRVTAIARTRCDLFSTSNLHQITGDDDLTFEMPPRCVDPHLLRDPRDRQAAPGARARAS